MHEAILENVQQYHSYEIFHGNYFQNFFLFIIYFSFDAVMSKVKVVFPDSCGVDLDLIRYSIAISIFVDIFEMCAIGCHSRQCA